MDRLKHGIKQVFMDCDKDNPGSYKTIQDLGGNLIREHYDDVYNHCYVLDYNIDVEDVIECYKSKYENSIVK